MTKDEHGNILSERVNDELDWTIKAVCKHCNETWMSDIESQHAKPAMEDLIVGKKLDIPLSQSQANSLALFAFKTAVICDYIRRKHEPFFLRSIRHRFRESLAIPPIVRMWMAGLLPMGKGDVITVYHEGQLSPTNRLKLYVCTYAVGHLVFQVVTQRQQGFTILGLSPGKGTNTWLYLSGLRLCFRTGSHGPLLLS